MKLSPDWLAWPETQTLIRAFGKDVDKLRFVGGAVRDSLLSIAVHDVDAATIFTPEQTMELLGKAGIRAIPTGIKHGTITAVIGEKHFELTTLRRDTACDGRHAEVEFTNNWQEDASRRDFTMNALYLETDGELFDYFGGVQDTQAGLVKFIGDASLRINEDYLRILRFFRFYAYYGKTEPDEDALAACNKYADKIDILSGERIGSEMLKLLAAPAVFPTLTLMQGSVLEQVFGFGCPIIPQSKERGMIALGLLLLKADIPTMDALNILAIRWKLSNEMKRHLLVFVSNIDTVEVNLPISKQKKLIRKLGAEDFSSVVLLKQALQPEVDYTQMLGLAQSWQAPLLPVSGGDLIKLGIPEGKELGKKLHELEMIWEDSDYTLNKDELLKRHQVP